MTPIPPRPKLYHITPVQNLPGILAAGALLSDARMLAAGGPAVTIGMGKLKQRRLEELSIDCLSGTMVGACVPFYFCPRSVMLYLIHMRNPEVAFKGGQDSVVHLEADLHEVLAWAAREGRPWAFSLSNAASRYAEFRADAAQLGEVDWAAVEARDWRQCREKKQAEFLVDDTFPWSLVRTIGVRTANRVQEVTRMLDDAGVATRPLVEFRPAWYY